MTATCPAWLRLSKDRTRLEVIEKRAAVVRSIFEDCVSGIGIYVITRRLDRAGVEPFGKSNGWHNSYIAKILNNRGVPHRRVGKNKSVPDSEGLRCEQR
jgi:hypothetical protein